MSSPKIAMTVRLSEAVVREIRKEIEGTGISVNGFISMHFRRWFFPVKRRTEKALAYISTEELEKELERRKR